MAFNGSGVFVLPYNWENDAASGINIRADRMDGQDGAIATGLSTCITKDGQQTLTANIPFSNFKILNLGNATAATDSINAGQVRSGITMWCGTSSGTNIVTVSSAVFPVTSLAAGLTLRFSLGGTNTGAVTVSVDGSAATAVLKNGAAFVAGDWTLGDMAEIVYDGTNFNTTSSTRNPPIPTAYLPPSATKTNQTSLASATTTDLGTIVSQNVLISGTTTITAFGSSANVNSPVYLIEFSGALTLTYNATSLILPGSANITTAAGDTAVVEYLGSGNWRVRQYNKANGKSLASNPPTYQYLASGSSATYNTPAGCTKITVQEWGGGGGGGAEATNSGADGGDTNFNSIVAKGGVHGAVGGAAGTGGFGGHGTTPGTGTADYRLLGTGGGYGLAASGQPGGAGGASSLGGAGVGAWASAGQSANANSASGGAGGAAVGNTGGGGGQAGEYAEFSIVSPAATYTYTIGAGGNGGAAGANAGGNGGSGFIKVTEYY